jgi:HEAT repeat protein
MAIRDRIVAELSEVLDQTATDNRVRIGAAISLARLRRENGVQFLLDSLDRFEEAVEGGQIAEARLQDLTRLRISSQEALTASGSFVVDFLRERIAAEDAGPIIVWAAAKTMGELGVEESADRLGRYLTEKRENPEITLAEDGATSKPVVLENWEDPTEEAVAAMQDRLEVMAYPDYVRWTCALALGRIGGESASELLEEAESIETEFLRRLRANRELAEFRMREPVINGLIRRHEDVLFYIRLAQQEAE